MLVLLSGEEDRDIHDGDYVVLFEEEREERSFYTERKVGGEKRTRTRTRTKHDHWKMRADVRVVSDGEAEGHRPEFCKKREETCVDNWKMRAASRTASES